MGRIVACVYIIDAPHASWGGNGESEPYARAPDAHHGAATAAGEWRAVLDPSQRPLRVEAKQILKQGHQAFAVGVQNGRRLVSLQGTPPRTCGAHHKCAYS
jgi:hypothetical protein